jgi:hypothetical protein
LGQIRKKVIWNHLKKDRFGDVFSSELKTNFALQIKMHKKYMKTINFWTAAIFCTLLCVMALITISLGYDQAWQISFLAFLPLCFIFIVDVFRRMNEEISELRGQIVELQKKMSSTKEL